MTEWPSVRFRDEREEEEEEMEADSPGRRAQCVTERGTKGGEYRNNFLFYLSFSRAWTINPPLAYTIFRERAGSRLFHISDAFPRDGFFISLSPSSHIGNFI